LNTSAIFEKTGDVRFVASCGAKTHTNTAPAVKGKSGMHNHGNTLYESSQFHFHKPNKYLHFVLIYNLQLCHSVWGSLTLLLPDKQIRFDWRLVPKLKLFSIKKIPRDHAVRKTLI
jgi:hypothetical protein